MHRHRVRARVGGVDVDVPVAIFAAGQFLRYISPSVGIITSSLGPGTTTINALATWGDTTGTQLLNTSVLLDNAGNMTQLVTLDGQDAPRITATLATASPTTGKLTKWASSSAPWKLDHSSIEVVHADGADGLYFVQVINGIIPERWVLGPLSGVSTDNAVVRWDGTNGRLVQDSTVAIDDSGNITGVTTLNGQTPGSFMIGAASSVTDRLVTFSGTSGKQANNASTVTSSGGALANVSTINTIDPSTWVVGPASVTTNRVATFNGTTGKLIQQSSVSISSGAITGVTTINSVDPATWVVGPASATNNQLATYNGTTGKVIQAATVTASAGALANVSTINTIDPATWVVGPASSTDSLIATYNGTTGKVIKQSGASVDSSGNMTVTTLNGKDASLLYVGYATILGNYNITSGGLSIVSGFAPGYSFTKRASSYKGMLVCDIPVSFPDSSITITFSCTSPDNVGHWQLHSPNNSGHAGLGTNATFAAGGVYTVAAFHLVAYVVVPSGTGTHGININITSSGASAVMDAGGTQYWFEAT